MISDIAQQVRSSLMAHGLETPVVDHQLDAKDKYSQLKELFTQVVTVLGLDLSDDSLAETPHRLAKMYVYEIFSGLDYQHFPALSVIDNKMSMDEMIIVDNIDISSTCEHHFVTIDGSAKVAYIPTKKIIGLSKINRIVQFFSQRPQVQERLTQQIMHCMKVILETNDVAVAINARHYCVKARGVMDANSDTSSFAFSGQFKCDEKVRSTFLNQS